MTDRSHTQAGGEGLTAHATQPTCLTGAPEATAQARKVSRGNRAVISLYLTRTRPSSLPFRGTSRWTSEASHYLLGAPAV